MGTVISSKKQIVKDNLKEDYLKKEEYRVLRFSDKDVLTDMFLPLPPPEGDILLGNDNE